LIMKTEKMTDENIDDPLPYFDGEEDDQQNWEDELCQQIEFSEDEDEEDEKGITIKGAAYYMVPPAAEKKGRISNKVDETKY